MKYNYKVVVDDSYELDNTTKSNGSPYVSDAVVYDYTSIGERLTIGGTVSNKLALLVHNPPTTNFDGVRLDLSIKEVPEEGDDGADVTLNVTDIDVFLSDMTKIEDGQNSDQGAGIVLDNIESIESDPKSETDTYEIIEDGTAGTNTEIPVNNNYRDDGIEITGEASADVEPLTDWIKFGTYYVTSYKKIDADTYQIEALDAFVLMGDIYTPAIEGGTIADYYADFTAQLDQVDIKVNDETFPNATIEWVGDYSFREAAGFFATFLGGYATFGREGYLDIRPYLKSTVTIPFSAVYNSEVLANRIDINAVACDRIVSPNATDYITLGEDDTIEMEFVNPFMTEELLQNVLDIYLYSSYLPCNVVCDYRFELQGGDFVQLEDNAGELEWICITNQEIVLDEGVTRISSVGNSSTLAMNKNISHTMKNIIEAGKTATNYITEDETGALVIRRDTDNFSVRIDADSVDIMNGEDVVARYGEEIEIGHEYPLIIKHDGVYLPQTAGLKIADGSGTYRDIGNMAIFSKTFITRDGNNNVIEKDVCSVMSDGTLEIYGTRKETDVSTSHSTFGGFYSFDCNIAIWNIFNYLNNHGLGDYNEISKTGNVFVEAHTNGNTGSGYVTAWRSYISRTVSSTGNAYLSTRLVSTSASNAGTVTLSYHVRIGDNIER